MFRLRKTTSWIALISLVTLLLSYVIYRASTQPLYHPTAADFGKIEFGLSEKEVVALLGPPHKVLTVNSSEKEFQRPKDPNHKVFLYYSASDKESLVNVYHVEIDTLNDEVCRYGGGGADSRSTLEKLTEHLRRLLGL
jgi:hypothetical protein